MYCKHIRIYGQDEEQKLARGCKNSATLEEFPGGSRDKFMLLICSREMPGGRENVQERKGGTESEADAKKLDNVRRAAKNPEIF